VTKPLLGDIALRRYRGFYMILGYFGGMHRAPMEAKLREIGYGRDEVKDFLKDLEEKGLITFRDGQFNFTDKGTEFHKGDIFKSENLGGIYELD